MVLKIIRQDITKMKVDAIVNAANEQLLMGGGVCGAIFHRAGAKELQDACHKIGFCPTGSSVVTPGFHLQAKYVIHTVGPIYQDGKHGEKEQLISCYQTALELALKHHLHSIAFPLISSGIYGYPKDEALQVARETIDQYSQQLKVYLVIFDKKMTLIAKNLYHDIDEYIDDFYEDEHIFIRQRNLEPKFYSEEAVNKLNLEEALEGIEDSFSQRLLNMIDRLGLKDSQVYHKANIDRKLFSKIRKDDHYHPSKNTVISLCIALELTLDDTLDLMGCAGYSLSHSRKFDVIVEYFIVHHNYNIYELNEALFSFDLPTL